MSDDWVMEPERLNRQDGRRMSDVHAVPRPRSAMVFLLLFAAAAVGVYASLSGPRTKTLTGEGLIVLTSIVAAGTIWIKRRQGDAWRSARYLASSMVLKIGRAHV